MNTTTLEGHAQGFAGDVKQEVGKATGNDSLQRDGLADQLIGGAKQLAGAARDAIANPAPTAEKAKSFAKARPYTAAALVGVVGLAVLNTLRGK